MFSQHFVLYIDKNIRFENPTKSVSLKVLEAKETLQKLYLKPLVTRALNTATLQV